MNEEYASATVESWLEHKAGGDYWTPIMQAQLYEVRAALQDPEYPHKQGDCTHGYGVLPMQYAVGLEFHDTRQYERGPDTMEAYYRYISSNNN